MKNLYQTHTVNFFFDDSVKEKDAAEAAPIHGPFFSPEPEDLLEEGPFPCILHWGFNHFVVLCGFKGKKAVVNDPARGHVILSWEDFDKEFTGVCITIEPGEDFTPSGKKKSVLEYAKERLRGTSTSVVFVVLTTTISSLMGMISPVFSRIFIDRLLTGNNPDWLLPFIAAMSVFALINITVLWIAAVYSVRIQGKMAAIGSAGYLWRVLRLPSGRYFRPPGDQRVYRGNTCQYFCAACDSYYDHALLSGRHDPIQPFSFSDRSWRDSLKSDRFLHHIRETCKYYQSTNARCGQIVRNNHFRDQND